MSRPINEEESDDDVTQSTTYTTQAQVHYNGSGLTTSPVYEHHFDFPSSLNNSAPTPTVGDGGSLFNGYESQDSNPSPPIPTQSPITLIDRTNNNKMTSQEKTADRNSRLGFSYRMSAADETNSSVAASSGYHSELGGDLDERFKVDRSKGHQNLNSSFDEDEVTLDFKDDDDDSDVTPANQRYPVCKIIQKHD